MNRKNVSPLVDDLLGQMTLEEKVGQLFLLAFAGDRQGRGSALPRHADRL